jgi:uncharacterized membrane protein
MTKAPAIVKRPNFFHRQLVARPRLYLAIVIGVAFGLLVPISGAVSHWIVGWDVGIAFYLVAALLMMVRSTPDQVRRRAQMQDESRWAILVLTAAAACFSLAAVGPILGEVKNAASGQVPLRVALAGLTILGSWVFMHTIFALHYAHEFYGDRRGVKQQITGGLEFPSEPAPDYLDFLYFSLVVGMTCQVSDVQITSRVLRRLALAHGVLSFFFNTVILALTVNIAASLL